MRFHVRPNWRPFSRGKLESMEYSHPPAPSRLGLIILILVTGLLLGILWYSGAEQLTDLKEHLPEWLLLLAFISEALITVRIGLSIIIVSCAFFIGSKIAAPRHQVSRNALGAKRSSEIESARLDLHIFCVLGVGCGTFVLVIGSLILIAWLSLNGALDLLP